MSREPVATWRSKLLGAVLLLLGTALAARVAWELLRPLVGFLAVILVLSLIYWLAFSRRR
ncbi:hypothetical protein ACH4OY_15710 [Micromonospora rubida]|uniref:DUF4175 domain-containing protein n=1 Tax=Micromonospora rubida TaxID=2697657 RepID=A0ABW7SKB3_9ACTN